jgi:hypothetical protein
MKARMNEWMDDVFQIVTEDVDRFCESETRLNV